MAPRGREISGAGLQDQYATAMIKFLLWLLLLVLCWPLAVVALILYPFVWLLLLPFRLVGIVFEGVFALIRALFLLPGRVLGG
jgi:hypothetical protein